jgi:hypothetical protein
MSAAVIDGRENGRNDGRVERVRWSVETAKIHFLEGGVASESRATLGVEPCGPLACRPRCRSVRRHVAAKPVGPDRASTLGGLEISRS